MEMIGLRPYDLDPERGTVIVRQGKGKQGSHDSHRRPGAGWVEKYLVEVRPGLLIGDMAGDMLFLPTASRSSPNTMTTLVRQYVMRPTSANGKLPLVPAHGATLMLENGADTRYIQAILGHAKLETTQIYTQVSIRKLKEIHTACHPSAKLKRSVERQALIRIGRRILIRSVTMTAVVQLRLTARPDRHGLVKWLLCPSGSAPRL